MQGSLFHLSRKGFVPLVRHVWKEIGSTLICIMVKTLVLGGGKGAGVGVRQAAQGVGKHDYMFRKRGV